MFRAGEHVRVPNPNGEGTLEAVYVTPSEPTRKRSVHVWVRYSEGPEKDLNARVLYSEVESA